MGEQITSIVMSLKNKIFDEHQIKEAVIKRIIRKTI